MKQTIGNACGTIGLLHSLANNAEALSIGGLYVHALHLTRPEAATGNVLRLGGRRTWPGSISLHSRRVGEMCRQTTARPSAGRSACPRAAAQQLCLDPVLLGSQWPLLAASLVTAVTSAACELLPALLTPTPALPLVHSLPRLQPRAPSCSSSWRPRRAWARPSGARTWSTRRRGLPTSTPSTRCVAAGKLVGAAACRGPLSSRACWRALWSQGRRAGGWRPMTAQ